MTNWYVKQTGDDSNDGSDWDNAVKSLQRAEDLVFAGDTVYILSGCYSGMYADGEFAVFSGYQDGLDGSIITFVGTGDYLPCFSGYWLFNDIKYREFDGIEFVGDTFPPDSQWTKWNEYYLYGPMNGRVNIGSKQLKIKNCVLSTYKGATYYYANHSYLIGILLLSEDISLENNIFDMRDLGLINGRVYNNFVSIYSPSGFLGLGVNGTLDIQNNIFSNTYLSIGLHDYHPDQNINIIGNDIMFNNEIYFHQVFGGIQITSCGKNSNINILNNRLNSSSGDYANGQCSIYLDICESDSNVIISGNILNDTLSAIDTFLDYSENTNILIKNNYCSGYRELDDTFYPICLDLYQSPNSHVTILDNIIDNISRSANSYGIYVYTNKGVSPARGYDVTISGNQCLYCDYGIFNYFDEYDAYYKNGDNIVIKNNLIKSDSDQIGIYDVSLSSKIYNNIIIGALRGISLEHSPYQLNGHDIKNNIIMNCSEFGIYNHGPTGNPFQGAYDINNNCFYNNAINWASTDDDLHIGEQNIYAYPLFDNDIMYDLNSGSPCKDKGEVLSFPYKGNRPDIGWKETNNSPTVTVAKINRYTSALSWNKIYRSHDNEYDAYEVSYGDNVDANNSGVFTTPGLTYKINDLCPHTKYYFKVRGVEG